MDEKTRQKLILQARMNCGLTYEQARTVGERVRTTIANRQLRNTNVAIEDAKQREKESPLKVYSPNPAKRGCGRPRKTVAQ